MSHSAPRIFPAKWVTGERDAAAEARLTSELKITPLVAALLANRGYADPGEAQVFLTPSLHRLHDPSLLPDYELAKAEILGAVQEKSLIYVHGDYDADGVTSTAILYRFLNKLGANVHAHVPHRMLEGYGIHPDAVDKAHAMGAKLFLTCDCGISAHEQVAKAREFGMRVVITDHHQPKPTLPIAHAIVNPHRSDSTYPFNELSGAGVALKLCAGLFRDLGHSEDVFYRRFVDLAALGTVADMMPLVDENRVIAKFGVERIADSDKTGIRALLAVSGLTNQTLKATHIGFQLAPRLNAVGRIDDAKMAYRLLVSADDSESRELAGVLEEHNQQRKLEQEKTTREAIEEVREQGLSDSFVIMVAKEGWGPGVVGLAAGKVLEEYRRPTFVLTVDPESGKLKGSARSIEGFHLAHAMHELKDLMDGGGHAMAAGCSFPKENLDEIRKRMDEIARKTLQESDFVPTIKTDIEAKAEEVNERVLAEIEGLAPFGIGNPEPTFLVRDITIGSIRPMRNPAHVNVVLRPESGGNIDAICFGQGEYFSSLGTGAKVDLAVQPEINEFNGRRTFRWRVKGVRPA
jgi:single-stranded-DNA-specific exonuclease